MVIIFVMKKYYPLGFKLQKNQEIFLGYFKN